MSVDKDVATALALEEPAKALLKAIEAALPAIDRLDKAKYVGADELAEQLGVTTEIRCSDGVGTLKLVALALERCRRQPVTRAPTITSTSLSFGATP
jgi:hypothetical protein